MARNDKSYLRDIASRVLKEIKEQQVSPPFKPAYKLEIREVRSGGWAVKLGIFRGYACSAEIWFDRFTAHNERKLYYLLYSEKIAGINKIKDLCKLQTGSPILLSQKDWAYDEQIIHVKKRFTKKDFGIPVFEKYPKHNEYLYGIYEYDNYGLQRNETKRLVSRVVEFIITINDAILLASSCPRNG